VYCPSLCGDAIQFGLSISWEIIHKMGDGSLFFFFLKQFFLVRPTAQMHRRIGVLDACGTPASHGTQNKKLVAVLSSFDEKNNKRVQFSFPFFYFC
jgi:hypothetical protein